MIRLLCFFVATLIFAKIMFARRPKKFGRFVKIRGVEPLQITEIQIYDHKNVNVAPLYSTIKMSSVRNDDVEKYGSNTIIDGNLSNLVMHGEVAITAYEDYNPTIEIDLGYDVDIHRISIYGKNCNRVEILDSSRNIIWESSSFDTKEQHEFLL